MSKRAPGKFKRRKQDSYDTPAAAAVPLLGHLPSRVRFIEPCAGCGDLVRAIEECGLGTCVAQFDIEPRGPAVSQRDALEDFRHNNADYIITNPPWTRQVLHPMIAHFSAMRPTWLLFDADWMHTKQAAPYLRYCAKIVSVGRVSWMQNGTSGLDNCAWYLFDQRHIGATRFFGRAA